MTTQNRFFVMNVCDDILEHEAVGGDDIVQCEFGVQTTKPISTIGTIRAVALMPDYCGHHDVWWRQPWNGAFQKSPHPFLKGKEWMVPSWQW